MKRFVAVVLVGACAVEEPELSTDMMASTNTMFGLEVEAGSTVSAIRGTDPTAASAGAYLSIGAGGYSRFFQRMYDPAVVYSWVRVKASAATTLTVQANNVAAPTCNVPITPTWTWVECSFLVLDVGVAELRISATGAVDVDRALFTGNPDFIPITDTYEAESGSLAYPMTIGSQRLPSARFIWVSNGGPLNGRADFDVTVPVPARYSIWLRANAPSAADDGLRIGPPGAFPYGWSLPITSSTGWTWSKLPTNLTLDAASVLSVYRDEDGVKLDKFLVTNDSGFKLVEASPPPVSTL